VTEPTLTVAVTDKAKERLLAALAREAKARFVRIDVGRG
jgi:Fe-S cluster assembly iron-binding protein IscA